LEGATAGHKGKLTVEARKRGQTALLSRALFVVEKRGAETQYSKGKQIVGEEVTACKRKSQKKKMLPPQLPRSERGEKMANNLAQTFGRESTQAGEKKKGSQENIFDHQSESMLQQSAPMAHNR